MSCERVRVCVWGWGEEVGRREGEGKEGRRREGEEEGGKEGRRGGGRGEGKKDISCTFHSVS